MAKKIPSTPGSLRKVVPFTLSADELGVLNALVYLTGWTRSRIIHSWLEPYLEHFAHDSEVRETMGLQGSPRLGEEQLADPAGWLQETRDE